jgi:hypothetical protein
MKVFGIIAKIVIALAAIAGIAYVIVNYGDQIVAWFKKVFGEMCCCKEAEIIEESSEEDVAVEPAAEEEAAAEGEVVAAEGDFEG